MGERELIGVAGLVLLFVLLALRVPVGLAMILVGVGGNYALSEVVSYLRFEPYLKQFKTLLWNTVASYDLSVVPLFILMGYFASHAQVSRHLFEGVNALLGRMRGGAAMAAIGASAGFGAVCGSSLATASTMGRIALPELRRLNYDSRLAAGALAAGGTLGILIPPSVALVLYAIIVEASIVDMFRAAMVPATVAIFFFVGVIALRVRLKPALAPAPTGMDPAARRAALLRLLPVVVIFGGIVLGLSIGLFTPTPAAAIGAFVILLYGLVMRRFGSGLGLPEIRDSLLDTASNTGMIYFILFGAEVLKGFFSRAGLPEALAAWAGVSGLDPWVMLIGMLIILILLGCFMESLSMILVVVPFLWPVLSEINGGAWVSADSATYGLGEEELKIWFGILALVVVELGLITPPVGLNVFIISTLAKGVAMRHIFIGVLPFFAAEILRVALLILFPVLTLWLPGWLSG